MFDQFKAMGSIAGLLKNKNKLQASMQAVRDKLAAMRLIGEAGGGAVRAIVTGRLEVIDVQLDPALASGLASGDAAREQAQALIAEAVNDGLKKAQTAAQDAINEEAKALGLPDLGPQLSGMLG